MTSAFSLFSTLRDRIASREARVATVGLGYVGLPMILTIAEAGYPATGFDLNAARVADINAGKRVISYFAEDRVAQAIGSGRFHATADAAELAEADVILLCVPTPLDARREPDLSYVVRAAETVAAHLRPGQMVVLESTVWPGATRTVIKPLLESSGLRAGVEFFLAFSPEREDPGNESYSTRTIPKVVGADDAQSAELVDLFYSQIVARTVPVSSTATAEAVKLAENSFRTVNIALVNEMKVAMGAMGVDVWEVVRAASTKPFGYMPFYPGPGIGGDCIPVSPVYLAWRARDVGSASPMIELAIRSNEKAPDEIAGRIAVELASRRDVPIGRARILILGIAYKKNVEDTRESPALNILGRLEQMGARCDYHDPYFPVLPVTRDHAALADRQSVALTDAAVASYDAVVVATDHAGVDYALVGRSARLIMDTRNVFAGQRVAVTGGDLVKI